MDNIQAVKGRTLDAGQRVFVYWNLHKNCFSIKDVKTGLVVAHAPHFALKNAEFVVNESGRQRVLREQRKNVHAGVRGIWRDLDWTNGTAALERTVQNNPSAEYVTYNPYKYDSFVVKSTEAPIMHAECAIGIDRKIVAIG